jgi:hypothetical protein
MLLRQILQTEIINGTFGFVPVAAAADSMCRGRRVDAN